MLNIKKKPRPLLTFNLVCLADLSFLLLIFFLTSTANSSSNKGMDINLPKSTKAAIISSDTTITISAENKFFINGSATTLKGLKKFFQESNFSNKKEVIIAADKSVPVDSLIKVADIISTVGLKINISTNTESSINE